MRLLATLRVRLLPLGLPAALPAEAADHRVSRSAWT
jgi:hypothetical protein